MKSLAPALLAHYQLPVTTIATCWKCTLKDLSILGFTNYVRDLVVDGRTYLASSGYKPSAVQTSSQLNVDNMEVEGVLDNTVIREIDLITGVWDYAQIEIFEVNYMNPLDGINVLRTGTLGQIGIRRNTFVAELRGLLQGLQQPVGRSFGINCDADFGDSRCGINLATWTSSGSITSITGGRDVTCSLLQPSWSYSGGLITMTSGVATGLTTGIKSNPEPGHIILYEPFPFTPAIADTFTIKAGCDKSVKTCGDDYSNVVNFRGFPNLPGQDRLISGT